MKGEEAIRFDGRAILVTGGARGMGRSHALMLADRGARVLIADRGVSAAGVGVDPGPAGEVVDEIGARRGSAAAYLADLSTEAGAVGAVDTTLEAFGRIDGIVHNASTAPEMEPIQRPRPSAYVRCQQIAKVTRSVW